MNHRPFNSAAIAVILMSIPAVAAASPSPPATITDPGPIPSSSLAVEAGPSLCRPSLPITDYLLQRDEPPYREEIPSQPEDANWPVVRDSSTKLQGADGQIITVRQVTRRNPHSVEPAVSAAASNYCSYQGNFTDTQQTTVGGVTQYEKVFYYRYKFQRPGFNAFAAYWIYKTQEYWTRTATTYTVGKNSSTWTHNGWTCSNSYTTNSATGTLTPNWYTNTRTYDYFYDHTKNWVTKTPLIGMAEGKIQVKVSSPIYKGEASIGTATTSIRLYGNLP